MKVSRTLACLLPALATALASAPAQAWVETHVVSDDVRIEVERSGMATVDHAITMRIQGGPFRSFDLPSVDRDATPLPDSTVITAQTEGLLGLPVPLQLTPRPDGAMRVNIEAARGISRGVFLFHVRYRKNLLGSDAVQRDGAMLRIRWTGAAWQEGLDNARCTFVLPPAPTEPRAPGEGPAGARPATDDADDFEQSDEDPWSFISQVKRFPDHDEIELIRPHAARAEAVRWSVRVDPRALGNVNDPRLRPPKAPPEPELIPVERRAQYGVVAALLTVLFSWLTWQKARQVRRHADGVARVRTWVPLPTALRVLLAGPVLTAGVALQVFVDDATWGTMVVFLAMALGWYRRATHEPLPRGPGRWLPLADTEAFAGPPKPRGAWLDASTLLGKCLFGSALGLVGLGAYLLSRQSGYAAYLVLFDSAVLFPLFGTGRLAELPPDPITGVGPGLGRLAAKLRKNRSLRVIAWGRLPNGSEQFDELRLLIAPRLPRRGFSAIEVGMVTVSGIGGYVQMPEVLLRVIEGSACHESFSALVPGSRWMRGRKADERVLALHPRLPLASMTLALAARVAERAIEPQPSTDVRPAAPSPAAPLRARRVTQPRPAAANPGTMADKSGGKPDRSSNAGTVASPFHLM